MTTFRRLLKRPSIQLIRSILIPLTIVHGVITIYAVVVAGQAANSIAFDRVQGIAQATATQDRPSQASLERLADNLQAHRVWIVSATGRILASNREGEVGAPIDPVWWKDLPEDGRDLRRRRLWGEQRFVQIGYHNLEAGVWSMIIADVDSPLVTASARVLAILVFSLSVWLLLAGSITVIIQRRLGKGLDMSDLVARKALAGEPISDASLARTVASISSFGPGRRLLALVERMQERAARANEAESRFSLALELLPGMAYMASYEGTMLWAGHILRERLPSEKWIGKPIESLIPGLPLERVHTAAVKAGTRGVTFDQLPVREEAPGSPAMVASIRSVAFRGTQAYLAHLEVVDDAGLATRPPFSTRPETEILEQLLDQSQEAIVAFDGASRTVVWNRAVERLTGTSIKEAGDLRAAIGALTRDEAGVLAFAEWMDHEPDREPLVLPAPAADGIEVLWSARDITLRGRTVGGALFGVVQPVAVAVEALAEAQAEAAVFPQPAATPLPEQTRKPRKKKRNAKKSPGQEETSAA